MPGVLEAFDAAVEASVADGSLDPVKHGAAIEAARKVAATMDDPAWPMANGKMDNVSPGVFLKYCDALGIVPTGKPAEKQAAPKLAVMVGSSKFSKAAHA